MPRSKSPRKHHTYKDKGKHRKRSGHRDDSSPSRSRSDTRSDLRHSRRHHHTYSRNDSGYSYKDGQKYRRRKYYRSRDFEHSRHRRSRDYDRKKYSRKRRHHYRSDKKRKYEYRDSRESSASASETQSPDTSPVKKYSEDDSKDRSKDAGHYKYKEGDIISDRFKLIKHLGDGTFGRVLEAEDIKTQKRYAMKVVRAVERYVESAQTEAKILEDIKSKDPEGKYQIVRLESAFLKDSSRSNKEQNYFMVFEKLGMSLYDFLKMNNYKGFSMNYIQSFARQILTSIGFMHSIKLTHTDLKPENILLVNDERELLEPKKNTESDDRSSTRSKSQETVFYKPKYDAIKIIDMGGATYDDEHHSSIINTRQYRAPEVMLQCCQWGHESDVWSIGCILLELYTGDLFFETHETYEHLAMIDRACGFIPYWMGNRAESKLRKHFILEEDYFKKYGTFFDWPKGASGMHSIKRVEGMKLIDDIVPTGFPEFKDLVRKMLTIDPKLRINCEDALQHDFFKIKYE